MKGKKEKDTDSPYVRPKELAQRWRCARSTVDRIADREGFRKLHLGNGANSPVRYFMADALAFESGRVVT